MCSPTAPIARPRSRRDFKASGFKSRIHRRARRNHPLSQAQRERTATRARSAPASSMCSEHSRVSPGGRIVRTIGIVRARAKIGLQNLAYNIRRLVTLERIAAA